MKCSLLTLSTFIDGEMPADRRAEVDAHLVGCPRCSSGVETLGEEKLRVAQLARVRVPSPSATALLEAIGVSTSLVDQRPSRSAPDIVVTPPSRPWLEGRSSAALPWTPLRPTSPPPVTEEMSVPLAPPDAQPDLPFDSLPPADDDQRELAGSAAPPTAGREADQRPVWEPDKIEQATAHDAWELGVPGYAGQERGMGSPRGVQLPPAVPARAEGAATMAPASQPVPSPPPAPRTAVRQDEALDRVVAQRPTGGPSTTAAAATRPVPSAAPPMAPVTSELVTGLAPPSRAVETKNPFSTEEPAPPSGPPRRAEADSRPRSAWNRARDFVGVRLALSSAGTQLDDSVEIVTGPARPARALPPPIAGFESPVVTPARVAAESELVGDPMMGPRSARTVTSDHPGRLRGAVRGPSRAPAPAADPPPTEPAARTKPAEIDRSFDWNAFGGSGFEDVPPSAAVEPAGRAARKPLGRHTEALHRRTGGASVRMGQLATAAGAMLQRRSSALGSHAGRATGSLPALSTRRRAIAGGAALVVILLAVLLVGRLATPSSPATAVRPTTAPLQATNAPHASSAPIASGPAASAPATAPPALAGPLTFGSGGNGFQLARVRYGVVNSAQRVVFDLGPAGAAASGTPAVVVGMSGPTTMLVTFSGTLPAGTVSAPPGGGVVQALSLASSSAGQSVYKLLLTRAAAPSAFYLTGPLRFVLDIH